MVGLDWGGGRNWKNLGGVDGGWIKFGDWSCRTEICSETDGRGGRKEERNEREGEGVAVVV